MDLKCSINILGIYLTNNPFSSDNAAAKNYSQPSSVPHFCYAAAVLIQSFPVNLTFYNYLLHLLEMQLICDGTKAGVTYLPHLSSPQKIESWITGQHDI